MTWMNMKTNNIFENSTSIEILNKIERGKVRHAVLDFDGTISLIRDGWQNVMVPMMIDVLMETPTNESRKQLESTVVKFVDQLTGKQTIYQMIQLCEEIQKRGGTAKDPLDYKDMYNDRLLPIVNDRITKLENQEITSNDLRVPMSLEFLQKLTAYDIKCYLASGTDIEFVKHEAKLLGVAEYFDGGIFGALREFSKFSKEMVIKKILADFDLNGSELLIVGDGYVEIQNAKSVNAIAVGVVTKENNIYDMNANKHQRLIRAGADIIIPDFREADQLLSYLLDL
jgi:phosphoglycolate phosphatase-like HAD superfamily hydrolase|tara:strand:- start:102 stop:953 length:852 start_codon:yes stop_codon:yes gene_type:complete